MNSSLTKLPQLFTTTAFLTISAFGIAPSSAAYLLAIDVDGSNDGAITFNSNFSFAGDTTIAATSSQESFAFGMPVSDSLFGGNGIIETDTYMYSYSPSLDPDNLPAPIGTPLGNGNFATGVSTGGQGTYSVYATWPFTDNVTGGLTTYNVITLGDAFNVQIDQNGGGLGAGNEWIKLGEIEWSSGEILVTQTSSSNTFVSMRAAGLLFEPIRSVPEPTISGLLILSAAGMLFARRRHAE
ncbi:PEP-CTERM sorting domain-containing protein [Akkermansiaceae bacterium]|nr:PEP-CTERM sorting domain-containing protein [Akkermansiaceae bacterium]